MRSIKAAAAAGVMFLTAFPVWADYELNLRTPKSQLAQDVYDIHTMIMVICLAIFVVVFGAMFYSIWKHRKSVGHQAEHFHENTTVEVIWTIIPFVILIGMAYPATKTVLDMKDTSNADITVKVTGYQWKWGYEYLQEGISFLSTLSTPREQIENLEAKGKNYLLEVDNEMVVPVGKKVRLLITAADVIHSWWIPEFSIKQDAIPGFIRDAWFKADETGVYRGQCVELCGKNHAFMPIVVRVVEQAEYDAWVAEKKGKMAAVSEDPNRTYSLEEMMARGEKVYSSNCAACHQANGKGLPGAFPAIDGSKVATGPVTGHMDVVLHGRPGTAMRAWADQLSPADIAAVITYQRNSWSNKTGDVVQPSEVAAKIGKS
jgi:cytochrome c oxidase subunit II